MLFVSRSSRRRRRTCRQRRRHEGGKALVAERVASEKEILQRGVGEYYASSAALPFCLQHGRHLGRREGAIDD